MPDVGTAKPLKYHAYRVKELGNTLEAATLFHVSPSDFLVEPLSGTALERPTIAEAGGHVALYPGRSGAHRLHSNPMDPRSLEPAGPSQPSVVVPNRSMLTPPGSVFPGNKKAGSSVRGPSMMTEPGAGFDNDLLAATRPAIKVKRQPSQSQKRSRRQTEMLGQESSSKRLKTVASLGLLGMVGCLAFLWTHSLPPSGGGLQTSSSRSGDSSHGAVTTTCGPGLEPSGLPGGTVRHCLYLVAP